MTYYCLDRQGKPCSVACGRPKPSVRVSKTRGRCRSHSSADCDRTVLIGQCPRLTLSFQIRSNTDAKPKALIGQESAPKPPPPLKDCTCKKTGKCLDLMTLRWLDEDEVIVNESDQYSDNEHSANEDEWDHSGTMPVNMLSKVTRASRRSRSALPNGKQKLVYLPRVRCHRYFVTLQSSLYDEGSATYLIQRPQIIRISEGVRMFISKSNRSAILSKLG
uniref:Uncharacterized protein n=1 Tax=Timema poppense TaxID=170557 RepID=A0A7R9CT09_TIMPO|nr:unnamed protein product [Timema poppensis]